MRRHTNSFLWGGNHFEHFFCESRSESETSREVILEGILVLHLPELLAIAFFYPISFFLVVSSSGQGRSSLFSLETSDPKKQKVYQSVPTLRWCLFAARNLAFWEKRLGKNPFTAVFFFFWVFLFFYWLPSGKMYKIPRSFGPSALTNNFFHAGRSVKKPQIFSDNLSLECPKNPLICLYYPPWH